MAKYIHVTSAGKIPENRGSSGSPFEDWETDPNINPAFGPNERTMFLLVDEPERPTVNNVTEKVTATYTDDIAGKKVRGVYVAAETLWRSTWLTEAQDLETAREYKKQALQEDKDTALSAGYSIGQYVLPYTEDYFSQLTSRKVWMTTALSEGDILGTDTIVLQDANGRKAELTNAQFENHYSAYGLAFTDIAGIEHAASEEVDDAIDLAAVDAVAWSFAA